MTKQKDEMTWKGIIIFIKKLQFIDIHNLTTFCNNTLSNVLGNSNNYMTILCVIVISINFNKLCIICLALRIRKTDDQGVDSKYSS